MMRRVMFRASLMVVFVRMIMPLRVLGPFYIVELVVVMVVVIVSKTVLHAHIAKHKVTRQHLHRCDIY